MGHGLELQEEDALLAGLAGGAGRGGAVIVGQEEAVALSSGPAPRGDVLVTRARQVGQDCVALLHHGARGDLENSDALAFLGEREARRVAGPSVLVRSGRRAGGAELSAPSQSYGAPGRSQPSMGVTGLVTPTVFLKLEGDPKHQKRCSSPRGVSAQLGGAAPRPGSEGWGGWSVEGDPAQQLHFWKHKCAPGGPGRSPGGPQAVLWC